MDTRADPPLVSPFRTRVDSSSLTTASRRSPASPPRPRRPRPRSSRLKPRLGAYRWSGKARVSLLTRAESRVHPRPWGPWPR